MFWLSLAAALAPVQQRDALATAVHVDAGRLVLDGDPSEWANGGPDVVIDGPGHFVELAGRAGDELWSGPDDCSLELWVGWNATDLIVGGRVRDQARDHDEVRWYQGDGLELFLGERDGDPQWGLDDWQVMLAPDWPERPWGVYPRDGQVRGRTMTARAGASHGGFGGVEVASVQDEGGYLFEARVPWINFAPLAPVVAGRELAFNVAICDRDGAGPRPGTSLESYGTWTAESDLARAADRRGRLRLAPPEGQLAGESTRGPGVRGGRPLLFVGLAAVYGLALWTRRLWRRPRARFFGISAAALCVGLAGTAAWLVRARVESERASRERELEAYWERFEQLLRSGALGNPEPGALVEDVDALLSGRGVAPVFPGPIAHLAPEGARFLGFERTARRGVPFRPFALAEHDVDPGAVVAPSAPVPGPAVGGAEPEPPGPESPLAATGPLAAAPRPADRARPPDGRGILLGPGDELVVVLEQPLATDAVHLVTRVFDPRFFDTDEQVRVLSFELRRRGLSQGVMDVRHRQDLHHEEDDHRDHPGLEPAFHRPGGRLGTLHADALLFELESPREVDELVLRNLGDGPGYEVQLVAAGLRRYQELVSTPPGLQANADGDWVFGGYERNVEAEVLPLGRAPRTELGSAGSGSGATLAARLVIGTDQVGSVVLRDTRPLRGGAASSFLPIGTLAAVAPFLVAMFAEWLGSRRRIRGKLAVGFVVSSAIPLLALTILLDASLSQAHQRGEGERAQVALARAEADLARTERELEDEAARLLRIAQLERARSGAFPASAEELGAWWGDGGSNVRILEYTEADGRRKRVGAGAGWREIPARWELRSGPIRPWGRLLVGGVARTRSGASQPLAVLVACEPPIRGHSSGGFVGAYADSGGPRGVEPGPGEVRLLGAGRDPQPPARDLTPGPREVRRPVLGREQNELAGVLVIQRRERGVPVLGSYSLTELLLAAGVTALFTALLFAGILTGHIVGPIERLDRAVRGGTTGELEPAVDDEIGHLTRAIAASSREVSKRVNQLETLQGAHEELTSRLDADEAREAVLAFFLRESEAERVLLLWVGERGDEPRLYGPGGANWPVGEGDHLLKRALSVAEVTNVVDEPGMPSLSEAERARFAGASRVLGLPLVAAAECRGALMFAFADRASGFDLAYLRTAAAQAAVVLENARLYERAVSDPVTGFHFEPAFRQRLTEEIQRAQGAGVGGVLVFKLRLSDLPGDDELAAGRLREAARRVRLAVAGLALFGRSGVADLTVAVPRGPQAASAAALEQRLSAEVSRRPWPDGEPVRKLASSHAVWPDDGPSARFVLQVLDERLVEVRSAAPSALAHADTLPADFVAESPAMVELVDTVRRIAVQDITVLVSGETGVGKGRIAELLHRFSPRAGGTFLSVHCPSLSDGLIEDELFGHEVGAFTGAHNRRVGPFVYAAGGTVVLDEIGGLSAEGQVALLRVLESREVTPLGATRAVPLDVRIVATTSRNLPREIEAGRFRGDLFFRLNVAQVSVPPLRLRRRDLPALVASSVRRFNASGERPVTGVDPRVLDLCYDHPWPGNLRELENVLSRALIHADGGELRPEHLELEQPRVGTGVPAGVELNPRQRALLETLQVGERIGSSEHADFHGVSPRTALRDLMELVELGELAREGQKRGTRFLRLDREQVHRGQERQGLVG